MKSPSASDSVSSDRFQRSVRWVLASYWMSMFIASHLQHAPRVLPVEGGDKIVHFLTYTLLAMLCALDRSLRGPSGAKQALRIGLLLVAYAALDELLQIPVPGRACEALDFLADLCGIAVGLSAFAALRRFHSMRR